MPTYIQKVTVTSNSRSGWDSYSGEYEEVFIEEDKNTLREKVNTFVKENTFSRYGDFGICLEDSKCKIGEIKTYVEVKE